MSSALPTTDGSVDIIGVLANLKLPILDAKYARAHDVTSFAAPNPQYGSHR